MAAGTKVGVATVGGLQVTMRPKMPIDRLVFMIGYAREPSYLARPTPWSWTSRTTSRPRWPKLRRQAVRALDQGVLHGYREREDTLPVLRGRLRAGDQIARRFGLGLPLEVSYDEFTVDIAENQILLAAALRLMRMPGVPETARPP